MVKDKATRILREFKATVRKYRMIAPGDHILAACSGGPDSMALVSLLLELREEVSVEISIAHLNHNLRPEAEDDEAFVRDAARRWDLSLFVESQDVRRYAQKMKMNLEEAGRVLRYGFLRKTAGKVRAGRIATGHTMNDQAETLLMRLMRGTGPSGLAGIEPVSGAGDCPVVRPLIEIGRAAVEAYLHEKGIPFREDASNLDRRFLRNRIRRDLIPELAERYEPRIVEHLARLSRLIRDDEELLMGFIRELAEEFILRTGGRASLDVKTLSLLSPSLARRVAREFIRELKGDLRGVSFDDVESVLSLKDGKERAVTKSLILRRDKGRISQTKRGPGPEAFEFLWNGERTTVPGPAGLEFAGKRLEKTARLRLKVDDQERVLADLDKVTFPLVVRSRKPGDLYRPLGSPGRKKLKEILRARGIPREGRDRLPVFLSGGDIVWVPGLPVGEKFKVDKRTSAVFLIELIHMQ